MPIVLCLAFASGIAAALAGRAELRISPRPALLTRAFTAYLFFLGLVLVPVSIYFYVFHGDWFMLYLVDVRRVPSAIAMLGFVAEAGVGTVGFSVGAALVRGQRDTAAAVIAVAVMVVSLIVVAIASDRLAVVGSFAQYRGGFGLTPYASGPLLHGTIIMGFALAAGLGYLLLRLHIAGKRA